MRRPLIPALVLIALFHGVPARAAEEAMTPFLGPTDHERIYFRALMFYRPPASQSRWLDSRLLETSGDEKGDSTLGAAMADRLVERLGDRFCKLENPARCRKDRGAQLRVSGIRTITKDRAQVTVGCRLVWPGGTTTDNGRQTFVLARVKEDWKIVGRYAGDPK